MATTTTNFGWTVPSDTDLVKDGAAAIRTALGGVDTSFVDLKGGTTGQVLAKQTNADLDFVWTADATGIPASTVTTKGDLIAATAASTVSRLGVGTNGQYLKADSTASTGLAWATLPSSGKVLQVVQGTYSTYTLIASTTYSDSGLSATIIPTSSTSKILVMVAQYAQVYRNGADVGASLKLLRGSTSIITPTTLVMHWQLVVGSGTQMTTGHVAPITYLDSPATTSAVTYKTQGAVSTTLNGAGLYCQSDGNLSTIVLMEIGA